MTTETTVSAGPVTAELDKIRQREQAATKGPWRLITDSCDCGEGYGCSHGSWPHAIANSRANVERADGKQEDWDFEHSEIADLGMEDAEFIVAARDDVPCLLRIVNAVYALCRDTDGNWLGLEENVPVGEFQAALALITGEAAGS